MLLHKNGAFELAPFQLPGQLIKSTIEVMLESNVARSMRDYQKLLGSEIGQQASVGNLELFGAFSETALSQKVREKLLYNHSTFYQSTFPENQVKVHFNT